MFLRITFVGLGTLEKFKITPEQIFLTVGQNNYGNKIPFLEKWLQIKCSLVSSNLLVNVSFLVIFCTPLPPPFKETSFMDFMDKNYFHSWIINDKWKFICFQFTINIFGQLGSLCNFKGVHFKNIECNRVMIEIWPETEKMHRPKRDKIKIS